MKKTHVFMLFGLVTTLSLLIGASHAQSACSSYAFSNGRSFTNCRNLPVLNASLHWNYHQSNRSVVIAYRHEEISRSNWIAWALNPTGRGMLGAQSLVAFVASNGSIAAYTSPITSYGTALEPGQLSFAVTNMAAEFIDSNQMIIYAAIQLPRGSATSFAHLWQHGDISGNTPQRHITTGDHLISSGTIDFAATGAAPPESAPTTPATPATPTTPSTTNNCPVYSFSGGRTYSGCNSLPVLNAFLHWNYEQSSNSIDIAYRHTGVTAANWVAYALNPSGGRMIGAQSLVAFASPNGTIRAYTSPITSYDTALEEGSLSFAVPTISAEFVDNNQMIIYATIQLPQGSTTFTHLWQHGDVSGGIPRAHPTSGDSLNSVGIIDFATGDASGGGGGGSRQRKRNVHGVLNVVSWGILMPVGAMAARYMKVFKSANPAWFYLHVTCQTSAYIVGVAGWGTGLKLGSDSAGVEHSTHRNIGIVLFALGTLQVFALLLRPKPDHKYRVYWNVYHQSIGYTVIGLSIANIFVGLDILDPEKKWKNAYIGVIISLGVAAALLEAFTWFIVLKRKRDSAKNTHHATTNGGGGLNGYHA